MPGHCAPLPANTKASLASRTAVPVTIPGAFDPGGEIGERGDGVGPIGAERDEALRVVLAPPRGAAQQRADRFGRRCGERIAPAFRERPQRGLGAGRDDQRRQFRFRCAGGLPPRRSRRRGSEHGVSRWFRRNRTS